MLDLGGVLRRGGGRVLHWRVRTQLPVVSCTGEYGHNYPFHDHDRFIEGSRIMWDFMKRHPKQI